jgi:hypothetical protein
LHSVGLRGIQFGWLSRQQRSIFPGEFEPVGWAFRSAGSQDVVEHEDDGHRVAPREDSSQSANEKYFVGLNCKKSGGTVTVTGDIILVIAFACYLKCVQVIWRLVAESNQVFPESRFSRIWWLPAWKFHRKAFPASGLRGQIVLLFFMTFFLSFVSVALIAHQRFEQLRMAH